MFTAPHGAFLYRQLLKRWCMLCEKACEKASYQNLVLIGAKLRVRFPEPLWPIKVHAILASGRL